MTVEVLVEIKAKRIDQTFTYNVPKNLEPELMVGKRVLVPFGKQRLEGFILNIHNKVSSNLLFYYKFCHKYTKN